LNDSRVGQALSDFNPPLFSGLPFVALMISAVLCIIMGMGMPAVASYLIAATLAVPVLIKFGFIPLAAHMFVFYFACFSSVTPPVALATYAASGLAQSDPWKTGWHAFILASVAFLAPFIFIYSPALLLIGSYSEILMAVQTAEVGVILYVCAIQGYYFGKMKSVFLRLLLGVAGCFLIIPGAITDIIALVLVAGVYLIRRYQGSWAKSEEQSR
jgi:TRAP-type uncharacterized transport system fused permease subunit